MLLILRIEMEQFRFNMQMMRQTRKMSLENRVKMADSANEKLAGAQERVNDVRMRATRRGQRSELASWMQGDFLTPAQAILEDWRALERSLRRDTFYQPVSLDELTQVVRGLGFCERQASSIIPY